MFEMPQERSHCMRYRKLGGTGLEVSEIGLGAEWLERHDTEEVRQVVAYCEEKGINIPVSYTHLRAHET